MPAGNQSQLYQGRKTDYLDFQLISVLSTIFKQCTECITGNTNASWKPKSAVKDSMTGDI